jgi:pimeloyl-ACP methyl ester carboxylesterase
MCLSTTRLVLLPGLDGTGELFADFIEALPPSLAVSPVSYPADRFLSYADLLPFLCANLPHSEPFVLLAESFSTPLAINYAATQSSNLRALVLCAGFAANPIPRVTALLKLGPWFFKLRPPNAILERFLVGPNAPPALLNKARSVLRHVDSRVITARIREVLNCDVRSDLAKVSVPMMYLWPSNDRLISARSADHIRHARPDIFFRLIPGPHMILQREPRGCAALVSEFIQKLDI